MGHTCAVLTFDEKKYTKKQIQNQCDDWGNANADLQERNYSLRGLGYPIKFTEIIFDSYDEACNYLQGTFGNYKQTAVRYKQANGKVEESKTLLDLQRRITDYRQRIFNLDQPHYQGVKVKTIKCKTCGTVLPTAYCGKSFSNTCPICRSDLRPNTVLEKRASYVATMKELEKKYQLEEKKLREKAQKKGYSLFWAVACEVHS